MTMLTKSDVQERMIPAFAIFGFMTATNTDAIPATGIQLGGCKKESGSE